MAGVLRNSLAEAERAVINARPRPAKSAFELFADSVRKQYQMNDNIGNSDKVLQILRDAWTGLSAAEKEPFEVHARGEQARFQSEVQRYETMQTQYNQIKAIAQQAGLLPPERTAAPPQSSVLQPPPARQAGPAYGTHSQRVQQAQAYQRPQQQLQQQQLVQNQQQQLQQRLAQMRQRQEQFREQVQQQYGRGQGLRPPQQPIQQQQQQQDQRLAAFMASKRQAQPGASGFKSFNGILEQEAAQLLSNAGYTGPPTVQVTCQGVNGTMLVAEQRVMCECSGCIRLPAAQRTMTCTQFENHAGMGTAKKWKHSLRVLPGSQRDVPVHGPPISIGRWLEARGVNVDKLPFRSTPTGAVPVSRDVQAPPSGQAPPPAHRSFGTAFAPWSGQKEAPGPSSAFQPALAQRQQQHPALPHTHPRAAAAHQAAADGHGYGRGGRGGYEEMLAVDDDRDPMYAPRTTSHAHQSVGSGRGRGGGRAGRGGDAQRNLTGRGWGAAMASASGPPAAGNKAAGVQQHYTPWRDANEGKFTPINVRWSGERCSVCDVDTDYDHDQLITCDMCGITVHQSCYGVQEVPGVEDMWLCRACELREEGRPLPQCCLCPVAGGALKPTNISGLWCHAACLQWIPEVTVDDVDKMEPVRGIRSIQRERWELLCMLCKQRMGAKIQCHTCYAAYHPLCGRLAGLHMEIIDTGQVGEAVQNISYCPKHRPPQPQLSGIRRVEDSEEGGDLPDEPATPKLWNAQPFPMPPAAPLPTHPAGCARAMPLTKWVRRMHGTGAGATTEAGFWIPQEPAAEEETAGTPTEQTQLTSTGAEKGEDADDVVPAAQLLSLPAGIPERLAVECDGQPGDFIIRSQRVWSDDKDLSLLDYAQLSGNTRWEESVMVCPGGDEEKVALHVWLAAHNLDAATLRTLAANFKGHKLYVAQQKQAVKEENEGAGKGSEGVQQAPASDGGATKADPEKMPRQRPRKRTMTAQHDAEGAPEEGPQPDAVMDAVTAALRPAGKQASSSDGVRPPAKLRRLNSLHSSADLAQTGVDGEEAPAPVAPPLVQGHTPSELVGRWCRVWWPEDAEWYIGAIREYSASRGQHRVWYEMDGEAEWINLIREARNDRVQLLPGSVRSAWPPAPPPLTGQAGLPAAPPAGEQVEQEDEAPVVAPVRRQVQPATASSPVADTRSGPAEGAAAVGRRVSIYSAGEERFFHGTVRTYRADQGKHMILYEDGHADWVVLADEVVVWPAPKQRATAPAGTVPGAKPRSVPAGVPDFLPVCCNAVSGILDVKRLVVTVNGVEMSAGEFERQGGRAATRKWKSSIKLDVGNGVPGMSLESWMIQMGMEPPRPPRPTRATADAVRRRQTGARGQKPTQQAKQPQRRLQDTGTDAKRRPHHRSGCMCIVCRQARKAERVAKIAATTTANRGGAAKEEEEEEEPKGLRYGKRAFLEAVMQLPGAGARPHTLHEVPLSRCWAPAEWIMHRARQHAARDAQSRGDAAPSTATSAALHSALAVTSSPVVDSNLAAQFSLGPGAAGAGRALTMKEKLELCNATEHERIAFGKSGIHGWGLFARLPIRQDTMVVEFRGELLRRTVADAREVRYVEEGADCYIFNLDDDVVLDATQAGTIARFINHACDPSLYTKIVALDGELRLAFFARCDIQRGQELTYNYRFKAEEGEERLPCFCYAPNCTGFLNNTE